MIILMELMMNIVMKITETKKEESIQMRIIMISTKEVCLKNLIII